MGMSKSVRTLEERIQINQESAAQKKRAHHLKKKREHEAARRQRLKEAKEQREADEKSVDYFADGRYFEHRGLRTLGEILPNKDASNCNEALLVANLWCGLLGLVLDPKETILERELRVCEAYCAAGSPWLEPDGTLTHHSDIRPFDPNTWGVIPGTDTTLAGVPGADIQSGRPVFVPKLVSRKSKPAEVVSESVPDSTGNSIGAAGVPCMTLAEEKNQALRKEFEAECSELQKVQQQIELSNF